MFPPITLGQLCLEQVQKLQKSVHCIKQGVAFRKEMGFKSLCVFVSHLVYNGFPQTYTRYFTNASLKLQERGIVHTIVLLQCFPNSCKYCKLVQGRNYDSNAISRVMLLWIFSFLRKYKPSKLKKYQNPLPVSNQMPEMVFNCIFSLFRMVVLKKGVGIPLGNCNFISIRLWKTGHRYLGI